MDTNKVSNAGALPIFLVFLCMGFGDVVGPMVSLAKESFHLSNFVANLLPLMGFLMFGILSVPMGLFQDRKGKKYLLSLGLIIAFVGLVIPMFSGMYGPEVKFDADSQSNFIVILIAILFLGAGATILQVSGNPIMRDVSPEGKYSSNLSFGQTVKAIGSSLGFLVPALVAKPLGLDWPILFPIFAIMILLTYVWVNGIKITEKKDPGATPATLASCFKLLGNGYVFMMVLAIFLYVGAEVSMSANVPLLLKEKYNFDLKELGLVLSWGLFFFPIFIGRLLGGIILRFLKPRIFLVSTVVISAAGILMLYMGSQALTFAGIVLVGLGFANIFPLVFSITIDRMPERANELSGLMISAILGGAIIPPVFGQVSDSMGILAGFIVPLVCVGYICLTSFLNLKSVAVSK